MANVRFILQRFLQVQRRFVSGSGYAMSTRHCPPSLSSLNGTVSGPSLYELVCGARSISSSGILSHIMVQMPALSPTMDQGNIAKWRKKEGDKIDVGDVICEIETDKATLEFESLEEGYLAKILAPEGSKDVRVGTPIAITVEDPEEIKDISADTLGLDELKEKQSVQHVEPTEHKHKYHKGIVRISPSAKLLIAEHGIDTSSLVASGPRGTLLKGDVLAAIKFRGGSPEASLSSEKKASTPIPPVQQKATGSPPFVTPGDDTDAYEDLPNSQIRKAGHLDLRKSIQLMKLKRKLLLLLADIENYDIVHSRKYRTENLVICLSYSGHLELRKSIQHMKLKRKLLLLLADIENYDILPSRKYRTENLVIAKRLLESKQCIPHFYLSSDVKLDPLLSFRNELKEQHNLKVSVNDIVIKAVALALRSVPEANAYWSDEKGMATLSSSIDISIAVATEKGLMTPIIRNADQKTLSVLSAEVKELAEKARNGKLKPEQFQGGTFSISNLGMFPVDRFCAIINPPQACILAVGRGNQLVEPIIGSNGLEKPEVVTKMSLNLSADHRVIDAEIGGKFLEALCSNFRDLRRLFL